MKTQLIRLATAASLALTAGTLAETNTPMPANGQKVDNSAVNQRDQSGNTVTPPDQASGTKNDVEVTRRVRRALTKDAKLSVYAQNVKIITLNGQITLRGPVHTEEERIRVASIAQDVVGADHAIVNELEIKQK